MAAGTSQLDRWRKGLDALLERIEIRISGRAPSDPLYLTNRTWRQKLKIAALAGGPVVLLVAAVTIGAANRVRFDKVDPYEHPLVESGPAAGGRPPAAAQTATPEAISASTDLEVVNLRIAREAHPPEVTGMVRNTTGRKVGSAEVSYYLADRAGSLLGSDKTVVANVEAHGSVAFRMPLKMPQAEYIFVRDAHPN